MTYRPTYLPDGRKAYNPSRTDRDIWDEWAAFETQLRNEGVTDTLTLHMQSRERWRQEEEKGERWSEWQKRVWYPQMQAKPSTTLTPEEWAYLAETLDGANHPLAISIQHKASLRK